MRDLEAEHVTIEPHAALDVRHPQHQVLQPLEPDAGAHGASVLATSAIDGGGTRPGQVEPRIARRARRRPDDPAVDESRAAGGDDLAHRARRRRRDRIAVDERAAEARAGDLARDVGRVGRRAHRQDDLALAREPRQRVDILQAIGIGALACRRSTPGRRPDHARTAGARCRADRAAHLTRMHNPDRRHAGPLWLAPAYAGRRAPPSSARARSAACTRPPGSSSTMATKSAPKMSRWMSTQRSARYSLSVTYSTAPSTGPCSVPTPPMNVISRASNVHCGPNGCAG